MIRRRSLGTRIALVLFASIASCGPTRESAESLVKAVPIQSYPFRMDAEAKAKFFGSLGSFVPGDSRDRVVSVLGSPHDVSAICGKESWQPVRGLSLKYYIFKAEPHKLNAKSDHYVWLNFDNGGKLVYVGTNVEGLKLKVQQLLIVNVDECFIVPPGGKPRAMATGEATPL